jgi:hypothetical protein
MRGRLARCKDRRLCTKIVASVANDQAAGAATLHAQRLEMAMGKYKPPVSDSAGWSMTCIRTDGTLLESAVP